MKTQLAVLSAALMLSAGALHAKTFKWASASDIPTLDIHSQNNALGNGVHAAVYESLVYYNSRTFKIEPQLATSWREVSPTQTRFTLRSGVKFSDGSALTADDVVFSLMRAKSKTSNYAVYTQGIDKVVKVNDTTVDVMLTGPNPVLLNQLTELRIMSKAWAEKNKSAEPKDIRTKDESFAHRNAMGSAVRGGFFCELRCPVRPHTPAWRSSSYLPAHRITQRDRPPFPPGRHRGAAETIEN